MRTPASFRVKLKQFQQARLELPERNIRTGQDGITF